MRALFSAFLLAVWFDLPVSPRDYYVPPIAPHMTPAPTYIPRAPAPFPELRYIPQPDTGGDENCPPTDDD